MRPLRNSFGVHLGLVRLSCVVNDRSVNYSDLPAQSTLQHINEYMALEHVDGNLLRSRPTLP